MALVLLDAGLDGTVGLPDEDLTTLAVHVVHTRSLESQVILHRLKETGIFFGGGPTDLMLCLDSSLLMRLKVVPPWGRKATEAGAFLPNHGSLHTQRYPRRPRHSGC
jgi:hypothetical protein